MNNLSGFQLCPRQEVPYSLELLDAQPYDIGNGTPPLLFLHGAFAGAWIWGENFLKFFAARGFASYSLSFRGHGRSEGADDLYKFGLADFFEDVQWAIDQIGRPPVLIGHSMGALVAQLSIGTVDLAGIVLLAPIPTEGLAISTAGQFIGSPSLIGDLVRLGSADWHFDSTARETLRRVLVSDELPSAQADLYLSRMQRESQRALLEMQFPRVWRSAAAYGIPSLVVSAENDILVSRAAVGRTAWFHGADLVHIEGVTHAMMLDYRWAEAAEILATWLEERIGRSNSP
jgi:pimeloyl-ACP methyl ester carboxylesterase